jgi:hypothetical protein
MGAMRAGGGIVMRVLAGLGVALLAAGSAPAGAGDAPGAGGESVDVSVCRLIETSARAQALPVGFLTRLIWQESRFRPDVVSPAGAQGIAQFMPGTAGARGLANPFDPEEAIPKAAELLAELSRRFGNVGLAAAAYNGGPARVASWQAGRGTLSAETRDYVLAVTRRPVEDWAAGTPATTEDDAASCLQMTADVRRREPDRYAGSPIVAPWGVQIAGSFSKAGALAAYDRARSTYAAILGAVEPMIIGRRLRNRGFSPYYQIRAPAPSRVAADALCAKISRAGGACAVLRS